MTIHNFPLLSYDKGWKPLLNPESDARMESAIHRLLQSLVDKNGYDPAIGSAIKTIELDRLHDLQMDAGEKPLQHDFASLIDALRGSDISYAVRKDDLNDPEAKPETVEITGADLADQLVLDLRIPKPDSKTYGDKLEKANSLPVVISGQGRCLALLAYRAYLRLTESKGRTDYPTIEATAETWADLLAEIVTDNGEVGRESYNLAGSIRNYLRVKRANLKASASAIAMKLGGSFVTRDKHGKLKAKTGILEKCTRLFVLEHRYPGIVDRLRDGTTKLGEIDPQKLGRSDLLWLIGRQTERTPVTPLIKWLIVDYLGESIDKLRKDPVFLSQEAVEAYFKAATFGLDPDGHRIDFGTPRSMAKEEDLRMLRDAAADANIQQVSLSIVDIFDCILDGTLALIERAMLDALKAHDTTPDDETDDETDDVA